MCDVARLLHRVSVDGMVNELIGFEQSADPSPGSDPGRMALPVPRVIEGADAGEARVGAWMGQRIDSLMK
ncbi:hypothetical protein THIOKS11980002 [Thiocapsa sp. KS1]|nr:hypothetical protein THIOKS11980002 [Thiocapsa sp. KS1]